MICSWSGRQIRRSGARGCRYIAAALVLTVPPTAVYDRAGDRADDQQPLRTLIVVRLIHRSVLALIAVKNQFTSDGWYVRKRRVPLGHN